MNAASRLTVDGEGSRISGNRRRIGQDVDRSECGSDSSLLLERIGDTLGVELSSLQERRGRRE